MLKFFEKRIFIILLLCLQQVEVNSIYNSVKPKDQQQKLKYSHLTKKQLRSLKLILKNNLESFNEQDDSFLATEFEFDVIKSENNVEYFNNLIRELNETFYRSKSESPESLLKELLKKQNSLESSFQIYKEAIETNSKTSADHYRLHDEHLNCLQNCAPIISESFNCSAANQDGAFIFKIPKSDLRPFYAYCRRLDDNTTWTVIQRREDGSVNFNRGWYDYKHGFGDIYGEYWIGLERLHLLTNSRDYELQIYLEDFQHNLGHAKYDNFFVASEDEGYKLSLGVHTGDAGDSFSKHNNLKFTTYDRKNDISTRNCAQIYKGGWWFHDCYNSNLNGEYYSLSNRNTYGGINWLLWKEESLRRVIMLIRLK